MPEYILDVKYLDNTHKVRISTLTFNFPIVVLASEIIIVFSLVNILPGLYFLHLLTYASV